MCVTRLTLRCVTWKQRVGSRCADIYILWFCANFTFSQQALKQEYFTKRKDGNANGNGMASVRIKVGITVRRFGAF